MGTALNSPKAAQCIFCDSTLGPDTQPEHILLSAFGGRKTTTRADCSECNNSFGSTIDRHFAEQVSTLRNMFQMPSGTGRAPPVVRNVAGLGGLYDLLANGTPDPHHQPFSIMTKDNGRDEISFQLRNQDEFVRYAPHVAAKLGKTEEEIWRLIENAQAVKRTSYTGPISLELQLGGEEALRSIAKSALALLATIVGTDALRGVAFAEVRRFVTGGGQAFNNERATIDARPMPSQAYNCLVDSYGPLFNAIYVKSDETGRTVCYFNLYNLFAWQVVLAESGGPINVEIALAANPLKPEEWSDEIAKLAPIEFDWLNAPDDNDYIATTTKRLSAAMEFYFSNGQTRVISDVVDDVLAKHYEWEETIQLDERGRSMIAELARRLAHALMRIPTEEAIVIARPIKR